jgi:hypothetical protein
LVLLPNLWSNNPGVERSYRIAAAASVVRLDSLSIVEETFQIFGPDNLPLDSAFFEIDFIKATVQLQIPDFWLNDSLKVQYRVWPINFSAPVSLRDTSLIRLPGPGESPVEVMLNNSFPEQGLMRFDGLQSSGSISRGLTLGNNQDPVLNSAMNLQLNGWLTEDISILAVISDQNIPFQPEGTTQQIQDFDKVFMRFDGYGVSLTAGDFELQKPAGHFLIVNRKARGGMVSWESNAKDSTILGRARVKTSAAGAISRGKYARNQIQGIEGNQGPYRLRGNNNENFVMVLAGTERVFIDGRIMQRGMDRDYIIDYNTAEITFMPSVMITSQSRISVEFEYAERNFVRSMAFAGVEYQMEKATLRINYFNEQDHPNQPLFQQISDRRRSLMAAVGDSVHQAFDWNVDSTGFNNDRVMYRLTDSLGFDSVFVYSIDPEDAVYQPGFTFLGEGQGNYRQINAAANGRVYQWVAPVNGIPQGTHEPVIQLVVPGRHQMLGLGGDIQFSPNTSSVWEYSFSQKDMNLFSSLNKEDNLGHAFRVEVNDKRGGDNPQSWQFVAHASWESTGSTFRPIERYRPIEFDRNWNIEQTMKPGVDHLPTFSLLAKKPEMIDVKYGFQAYLMGNQYQGFLNSLQSNLSIGNNKLVYSGSILQSSGLRNTTFYRHTALYKRAFTAFNVGLENQIEDNRIFMSSTDSLALSSESFSQWEIFLEQSSQNQNPFKLFYRFREDKLPVGKNFENSSRAHDYGLQFKNTTHPDQRVSGQLIYREMYVQRERFAGDKNENTINIRGDYYSRWGGGLLTSSLFYESSSGRERRREFIYLEVPTGQGAYQWNDYNNNNVKELDEFDLSPYPDEANFIRIFIPTDDFVPVYATAVSHSLNLDPSVVWRDAKGWRNFLARFSSRLNYRIDNKRQGGIKPENFNPFFMDASDSLLVNLSSSVRNSLYFNRTDPRYSAEWTWLDNRNKNLLSNGFESRNIQSHILRLRYNLTRQISLHAMAESGDKKNDSEFFARRNYQVMHRLVEPSVILQPATGLRISLLYGYQVQENTVGIENAQSHRVTFENRFSFPSRGSLQLRYQIWEIDFPYDPNTPLAFEMLQGLRNGTNHVWNVNWQQNLNAWVQLSFQYNGRKPTGVRTIHTGSVQLRALF